MDNKEYLRKVSELFRNIEDNLDDFEDEIDYDPSPDKLIISFEKNNKKVVINTQRAIKEVWLAGNSKGWHFQFQKGEGVWFANAEQEEFYECLSNLISENLGRKVSF